MCFAQMNNFDSKDQCRTVGKSTEVNAVDWQMCQGSWKIDVQMHCEHYANERSSRTKTKQWMRGRLNRCSLPHQMDSVRVFVAVVVVVVLKKRSISDGQDPIAHR